MQFILEILIFLRLKKVLVTSNYYNFINFWLLIVLTQGSAVAPFIYTVF